MSLSSILFSNTIKQKSIDSITDICQGEDRDQNRILYLEKTIEKLKVVHIDSINGLHNEISRLNLLLSDLQLKRAIGISKAYLDANERVTDNDLVKQKTAIRHAFDSSATQTVIDKDHIGMQTLSIGENPCSECLQKKKIQSESETKESQTELKNESEISIASLIIEGSKEKSVAFNPDTSLFLLIQKERQKYNQLILKTTEEKKRKQTQLNQAMAQIALMRNALKMAGLEFDQEEIQKIVKEKIVIPLTQKIVSSSCELNNKVPLAPIQKINCDHESDNEAIQELLNKEENQKGFDSNDSVSEYSKYTQNYGPQGENEDEVGSDYMSEITAIEPKEARVNKNPRTEKLILKNNDSVTTINLHNHNSDYTSRKKYNLENIFNETKEEQVGILETLPPLIDKAIDSKQKSKTSYADRFWRTKRIKEKRHQDFLDKI